MRAAYGDSFGTLFLIAAASPSVTLLAVRSCKEVPLRTTVELKPQPVADGVAEHVSENTTDDATENTEPVDTRARRASTPSDLDNSAIDVLNAAREEARQLTTVAKNEAERILTVADNEVAALEKRIATLRQLEADLTARVSEHLQHQR